MVLSPVLAGEESQHLDGALDRVLANDFLRENAPRSNWRPGVNQYGKLAREMADGSLVLLKNKDNLLPLNRKSTEIHVVGPASSAVAIHQQSNSEDDQPFQVNIAVVGVDAAGSGRSNKGGISRLPKDQIGTIRNLKKTSPSPLIVVIMGGRPISLPEIYDMADAIIYAWQRDDQCSEELTEVLFGDVNPSGRLPFALPYFSRDLPSFMDDYMKGLSTNQSVRRTPQFPFGFGLSYDEFEYTSVTLSSKQICGDESLDVTVRVKNKGKHGGNEVVQLYLQLPGVGGKFPLRRLVGFRRIHIPAGEFKDVHFTVTPDQLLQSRKNGNSEVIPGAYVVTAGGSSPVQRSFDLGMPKSRSKSFAVEKARIQNLQVNGN